MFPQAEPAGPFLRPPDTCHPLEDGSTTNSDKASWPSCALRGQQRETDTVSSPSSQNSQATWPPTASKCPWVPGLCPRCA